MIKKEQDPKIKERLQAVFWRLKNEKYTEICKRLNRDNNTVSNWIKRWNKEGYKGLFDRQKSGRPTTLSIELFFLPAYSPDLNPIERLWNHLKTNFLNNKLFETLRDIKDTVYEMLQKVLNQKEEVKSVCAVS